MTLDLDLTSTALQGNTKPPFFHCFKTISALKAIVPVFAAKRFKAIIAFFHQA